MMALWQRARADSWFRLVVLVALLALCSAGTGAEVKWTVYPLERSTNGMFVELVGVQHGNGLFVAVGERGQVYRATDPTVWTEASGIENVQLNSLAFGAGLFVAAGRDLAKTNTVILTSSDGMSWDRRWLPFNEHILSLAYGTGKFLGVAGNNLVSSVDGRVWDVLPQPEDRIYHLDFAGGKWIGTGVEPRSEEGWPLFIILTSTDGVNWKRSEWAEFGSSYDVTVVTFGRGKYFAGGSTDCVPCAAYRVSSDGERWEFVNTGFADHPWDAAYGNGVFVVATSRAGPSGLYSSPDLTTWERFDLEGWVRSVTFGRNRFVGVGLGVIAVSDEIVFEPLVSNVRLSGDKIEFEA